MKKYVFDLLRMLFCSLVVLFFLMLPETLFGFIRPRFAVCWDPDKLGMLFLLSFLLSMVKSKKLFVRFLIVFGALQAVQLCSMACFGTYLTPEAADSVFSKTADVMAAVKDVRYECLSVFALIGVPYFILGYAVSRDFFNRVPFRYAWVFLLLYFAGFIYRASPLAAVSQRPVENTCYASFNTVNAFSACLGNVLPRKLTGYEKKEAIPLNEEINIETDTEQPDGDAVPAVDEAADAARPASF